MDYLGDIGLIVLGLLLIIILVPIFIGICISSLLNFTGYNFSIISILIAIIIWGILGLWFCYD